MKDPSFPMRKILWLLLIGVAIAFYSWSSEFFWRYLFFLRAPLIMGLLLILLPILAKYWLPAMLKNLFVLRDQWQLAAIIIGTIGSATAITSVAAIIIQNAPDRFIVPPIVGISDAWYVGVAIALSFYPCFVAINLSLERLDQQEIKWGLLVGISSSICLLFLVNLLTQWLNTNPLIQQTLVQWVTWISQQRTQGYINAQTGELAPGHLKMLSYLFIGFIVYLTVGLSFRPKPKPRRAEAPALLYLLIIISVTSLLYGGATFYLDYFRFPIVIPFLIYSVFSYYLLGVDHFFKLTPLSQNLQPEALNNFTPILQQRLQHQTTEEKTLVVVCASGGGIQAAGWTVQVLTGLQEILGTSFTQSIGLISAVSGGSVGTLYYLDYLPQEQLLETELQPPIKLKLKTSFEAATQDSLDAISWGLAYLDIWRLFGLPFIVHQKFDRGTAVETDWQGEMRNPKQKKTLETWRKQVLAGEIPIPIFNATIVENGWRFLISPVTFGEVPARKSIDFNTLYPGYDMNVVTAARLSATFPYVSPICRSNIQVPGRNYHFADGGYFDNSGFVTAAEWIDQQIHQWLKPENNLKIKRVFVLQINPFPEEPATENKNNNGGWFMATLGPLLAVFKVRDSILASRNAKEAELLAKKWENQVEIKYFPIFFPPASGFDHQGKYRPPLSWRLTDQEKQAIKEGWKTVQAGETIQKIKHLWHELWKMEKTADIVSEDARN